MQLIIEAIGFGIATGAVIALGAVGFSVQFGISNILNITYGALMTLAAYLGYVLISHGVNAWLALVLGALVVGAASRWCTTASCSRRWCAAARGRSRW